MKKLYIGNLSFKSTEQDLQALVSSFGNVQNVSVIRDKMTDRSRGFGFVEMNTPEEAQAVMNSLNGTDFQGRSLRIDIAQERAPRGDFGGNERGNGNRPYNAGPRRESFFEEE